MTGRANLTAEEREEIYRAGDHHPDHCDCSAYVIEQAFAEDDCCQALLDTFDVVASIVAARVEEARTEDQATIARVEAMASDNGAWKGERHVRITRRDPRLGADVTESYVKVSDLRAALASPATTGEA
jgi:hypothetical protein